MRNVLQRHHLQDGKVLLHKTNCMKMLAKNASRLAVNAPESIGWPGSARTRWGSLCAPPDHLAAMGVLLLRGGKGRGRVGRESGKGRR